MNAVMTMRLKWLFHLLIRYDAHRKPLQKKYSLFTIGTTNGRCFYFKAAGTSGPNMSPGNVTFRAETIANAKFRLEGHDFVTTKTVDLAEALLGCTVDVTTFDGKTIHVPVNEVIKPKHR